jgi:hypothetical protein
MDTNINMEMYMQDEKFKIDTLRFQKMMLLYNALEDGWTIKKRNNSYVFTKNHENKKEVLEDAYLIKFMKTNMDVSKILN